jgi:hypothetical protein
MKGWILETRDCLRRRTVEQKFEVWEVLYRFHDGIKIREGDVSGDDGERSPILSGNQKPEESVTISHIRRR